MERIQSGQYELPPGCEVTYDSAAVDILRALVRPGGHEALRDRYEDFIALHGVRPSALEMYQEGYNPRSVRKTYGSWFRFVNETGLLTPAQRGALEECGTFLDSLETTPMTKSFKMLVLLAMLNAEAIPGQISITDLVTGFRRLATRNPRLAREVGAALCHDGQLQAMLERNPIAAWTGGGGTGGVPYFEYTGDLFSFLPTLPDETRTGLQELTRELADWRLAEYLDRADSDDDNASDDVVCKVSHTGGRPMLFLPDRANRPDVPTGWVEFEANGETWEAHFVQVAVNVARRRGSQDNELPGLLRGWFGPDAGLPGTAHHVVFERRGGKVYLAPQGRRTSVVRAWQTYSREEIPGLFGLQFSRAVWNAGFVLQSGHMFLLATIEKKGKQESHQYDDGFVSADVFRWQSQNRTAQDSTHGRAISRHGELGIAVHLFVRTASKTANNRTAPFFYCGDVTFAGWEHENPITVTWKLPEPVPERLRGALRVSGAEPGRT